VSTALDFLLHSDQHLLEFVAAYGTLVYGLLFAVVFAETGFVVTPFLPGDSLLFATGALCATGTLNLWAAFGLLSLAAFTGNGVNYTAGRIVGPRVFGTPDDEPELGPHARLPRMGPALSHPLLNPKHVHRAHAFFEQYGGNAVILARFVPIVRTFMPFVAGAACMRPSRFLLYNGIGAVGWVVVCLGAGWLFGNVPLVKNNFSIVTIGIVIVSLLPILVEYLRHRHSPK
jgi:membrane-associated protein